MRRPSITAQWTTLLRALELRRPADERIVTDEYAPIFLDAAHRGALAAGARGGAALRWLERREVTALGTFVLCRHRYLDDALLAALDGGVEQVVLLGAGYDSRAYRFAEQLAGRPVFEVDLPAISRRKAALVATHAARFAHGTVTRVEIDFTRDSLAQRLGDAGFARNAGTFVVWEGVSMYLDRAAVGATLRTLAEVCGSGSVLGMDLWDGSDGPGRLAPVRRLASRSLGVIGEPVRFGIAPERLGTMLAEHALALAEVCTGPELARRYATDGRRGEPVLYTATATIR